MQEKATIWTNADYLSSGLLEIIFFEIWSKYKIYF